MLGKLIKYDFKAIGRNMLPVFGAMLTMTVIFTLMIKMDVNEENILFTLFLILYMSTIMASIFGTLYCVVKRFDNGLLKNEGYLSFALPVDTATHIAAKVIDALIWSVIQGLVMILSVIIGMLILGGPEQIREMLDLIASIFNIENIDILVSGLKAVIVIVLNMIASICMIFAAFAVAHMFEKHKKLLMTLFFVVFTTLNSYLSNMLLSISDTPLFREGTWYLLPVISTVIFAAITWYILDRRLNLE